MKGNLLFETVHGSHLYGTAHADSDLDIYQVYEGKFKTKQTIVDGIDRTEISLSNFMLQAGRGMPQALEAMFSQSASVDEISAIRRGFRPNLWLSADVYTRTIRNFARGELKQRRHAARLVFNLNDLWESGRFNPTLFPEDAHHIRQIGDAGMAFPDELYLQALSLMCVIDLRPIEKD